VDDRDIESQRHKKGEREGDRQRHREGETSRERERGRKTETPRHQDRNIEREKGREKDKIMKKEKGREKDRDIENLTNHCPGPAGRKRVSELEQIRVLIASERGRNNLEPFKDLYLKATASIWPQPRSTAALIHAEANDFLAPHGHSDARSILSS
jgi:hypothetical protein